MPVGVIVRNETRSGPAASSAGEAARFMAVGLADRGSTETPTLVRSMAEFVARFGDRVPYGSLYDSVKCYFEEGGSEAVIARVVGPDAATGKIVLKDGAAVAADTLEVSAASPGAWSTGLKVMAGTATDLSKFQIVVFYNDVVVHVWDNLDTPADAAAAAQGSPWVKVKDLGSVTAYPDNRPDTGPPTALSAGTDDRAAVTAVEVIDALDTIGPEWGAGAVAAPGYPADLVGAALIDHAKNHKRLALLASARTATMFDAEDDAKNLIGGAGDHGVLIFPWVNVPNGGSGVRTISPEGYAAAMRTRAHRQVGAWQAPAGDIAIARYVLSPAVELTRADGDRLDDSQVAHIRVILGTTRLYGWPSLSADRVNFALASVRDVMNVIDVECERAMEAYVHKPIDGQGQLLSKIAATLVGVVHPIAVAGGLFARRVDGEEVDPGYSIDVSDAVNPIGDLQANKVAAVVAVRPSPTASLITVTTIRVGLTAAV